MNDDRPDSGRKPRRSSRRATTMPPWNATTACSAPDRRRRASGSPEPRAILGLGDAFIDLGDADAAEAQFTRALGKDPQNAPILFRKGELLERKGRWGAAVQYHNRAIALRWNYPDPWLAKGEILLNHARPTEALGRTTVFQQAPSEPYAGRPAMMT